MDFPSLSVSAGLILTAVLAYGTSAKVRDDPHKRQNEYMHERAVVLPVAVASVQQRWRQAGSVTTTMADALTAHGRQHVTGALPPERLGALTADALLKCGSESRAGPSGRNTTSAASPQPRR